jgi:CSLREA domain-containing protein
MRRTHLQPLRLWALLLSLSACAETSLAATITVTATTDDNTANGTCTLREAIIEANADSQAATADCVFDTAQPFGDDTITLQAGMYELSLAGIGEDAAATGDLDITGPLRLKGAGAGVSVIDANSIDRAFHVVNSGVSVTFEALTVREGNADDPNDALPTPQDDGGCIHNNGALLLDAAEVLFCTAANNGGGVFNSATGTLTARNGSFIGRDTGSGGGNTAIQSGGGVYNEGSFTLDLSSVTENFATVSGAGVYNAGTLEVLNGSAISKNGLAPGPIMTPLGGGIYNTGAARIENSFVRSNSVNSRGGGIYHTGGGELVIETSTLAFNQADKGAGLINNSGTVTINDSTISNNTANVQGGGLLNTGDSMTLVRTAVLDNDAGFGGGAGIFNRVPLTLVNVTLSGNESGGDGAGLSNTGGATADLANVTIANNTAGITDPGLGGGILNGALSTVNLKNTIVARNGPDDCALQTDHITNSLGHNISGDATCDLLGPPGGTDQPDTDPQIGPLASNGGPTRTHALLGSSSPAVDRGDPAGCTDFQSNLLTTDQRQAGATAPGAFVRPIDGDFDGASNCDIGAFELQVHELQTNGCTGDLFFSEYVQGVNVCGRSERGAGSEFHAVEIYNGTASDIVLDGQYQVRIFVDGSPTATATIDLVGTVRAGDVFVLTDPVTAMSTDSEDQTSAALQSDGDDAIALVHGAQVLDVIGVIGQDPGTEWGSGDASTQDSTIRRLKSVLTADPDGFADPNDITDQWEGFCTTLDFPGFHETEACPEPLTPTPSPTSAPTLTPTVTATPTQTATATPTGVVLGGRPRGAAGLLLLPALAAALAGLALRRRSIAARRLRVEGPVRRPA